MQTWHGHGLRLAFQFSAWGRLRVLDPGKDHDKIGKAASLIEQVLGHPLFFLRLPSNAFPDIGKANTHGKTKAILFLLWSIWFCREIFGFAVRFLVFPWCFCFCREVFGFAVTVVGHHSFVPRGVLGVSSNISNMRRSVSSPDETPRKRVENTRRSGVFLTNFEVFHLVMKHCVECLIFLLKQNHFWRRN